MCDVLVSDNVQLYSFQAIEDIDPCLVLSCSHACHVACMPYPCGVHLHGCLNVCVGTYQSLHVCEFLNSPNHAASWSAGSGMQGWLARMGRLSAAQ